MDEDILDEDRGEVVMEEDPQDDEEEIEHSAEMESGDDEDPHTSLPDDGAPPIEHTPDTTVTQAPPKKIKRPSSAWIIYIAQNRPIVKAAHPEYGFKELSQALSEQFKALSPEEKKVYDDLAAADRDRWQKEVELYGHIETPPEETGTEIIIPMVW